MVLRAGVTLFCRLAQPLLRGGPVARDASSLAIHEPQIKLSLGVTLGGRFQIIFGGTRIILGHTLSLLKALSQLEL
jgi:hypothetical protein